jgi:hypothetical protein
MNITAIDSFPLNWPVGRERKKEWERTRSAFKTTPARARDGVISELKRLGARNTVISSNVETYSRGERTYMYADQSKAQSDPGVAVYYTWKDEQYCLSCDKYKTVMENLQAIAKTIEAIRGIERWGTGEMMKAAFSGFKALPEPPKETVQSAWEILGIRPGSSEHEIKNAYRKKVKIHHPDVPGGSAFMFNKIQTAYEELIKQ